MRVRFPPSGTRKTEIVLSFCLSKLLATTDFYDRILLLLLDMEGTMFTDLLTVRRLILMVMLSVATMVVGHHLRSAAQNSQALYEVMLAADVADFLMTGGGAYSYQNYYKWQYATWRNSPERTWVERALFWNVGFLYDATSPPAEYQYLPLYQPKVTSGATGLPRGFFVNFLFFCFLLCYNNYR